MFLSTCRSWTCCGATRWSRTAAFRTKWEAEAATGVLTSPRSSWTSTTCSSSSAPMSANRRVTSSATTGRWLGSWQGNRSWLCCWGICWKLWCFIRSSPSSLPPIIMMWEATGGPMSNWVQTLCLMWFNTRPTAWPESSTWGKGSTNRPLYLFDSIQACQVVGSQYLWVFIKVYKLIMKIEHDTST